MAEATQDARGMIDAALAFARRRPAATIAAVLAVHVAIWSILPILASPNLQLDLAEALALGKEWQLSYWKHPPLPWWLADLAYRATGWIGAVYLLGPLAIAAALYGLWLMARELLPPLQALIAVVALEGVHHYNFSAVKFAHDHLQIPFWVFTGLFFYRALTRQRALDWILAGTMLALAFWSKYAAFALAASLGLFLLLDRDARRCWRTPGPYLMAATFAVVIAPNVWGLVQIDFLPFKYVADRARVAAHWWQFFVFPLHWALGQMVFVLPAVGLFALLYGLRPQPQPVAIQDAALVRRYVTTLALGPFLVVTLVSLVLGRRPVALWGHPLWSFAPLAALLWLGPVEAPRRLRAFAIGLMAIAVAMPLAYAASQWGEPLVRARTRATDFPGRQFADIVTKAWRERTQSPLVYAGGSEFAVNNVAVYSPDRPHVVVHGDPRLSPWIDMADLRKRGMLLVWEEGHVQAKIDEWRKTFGEFEIAPVLVLPRQAGGRIGPVRLYYAIVPPRP